MTPESSPRASASCSSTSGSLYAMARPCANECTASVSPLLARVLWMCLATSQYRDCSSGTLQLSGMSSLVFSSPIFTVLESTIPGNRIEI